MCRTLFSFGPFRSRARRERIESFKSIVTVMWQTLSCGSRENSSVVVLTHQASSPIKNSLTLPSARLQATGAFIAILDQRTNMKAAKQQQTMSSPQYASLSSRQLGGALSKPIAIKRSDNHFDLENHEDHEQHEKQFYECATWRMYNRIVDHRLHSPLQQAPIHQHQYENISADCSPSHIHVNYSFSGCSPQQEGQPQLVRPKPRYARAPPLTMPLYEHHQYQPYATNETSIFDEEVFELEL